MYSGRQSEVKFVDLRLFIDDFIQSNFLQTLKLDIKKRVETALDR